MIVIDEVAALKGLRHAVNLKGPNHRSSCVYARLDRTTGTYVCHCIVGTALENLGVAPSVMVECGNKMMIRAIVLKLRDYDVEISPAAADILNEAQFVQDGDSDGDISWGAALRSAELLATCSPVPGEQGE